MTGAPPDDPAGTDAVPLNDKPGETGPLLPAEGFGYGGTNPADEPAETRPFSLVSATSESDGELADASGQASPGAWVSPDPGAWGVSGPDLPDLEDVEEPPGPADEAAPGPAPRAASGRAASQPAVKQPRRQRRRPPRGPSRWRTAFFALAAVAVVTGVGWALLGNRLLVVRSVSVSGTHLLAPAQVTAAANVPLGTPLFSVNTGAVSSRVEAIRQVASVTVTRGWPDGLTITVTERVPLMAVKMAGGGYDQVDKDGVIVRWTPGKPKLPALTTTLTGAELRGSTAADTAATVLSELRPALAGQVTAVKPTTVTGGPEQVTLTLRSGQSVIWGAAGDAALKNRELAIVLRGGARHIDVSAPGTVVAHLFAGGAR